MNFNILDDIYNIIANRLFSQLKNYDNEDIIVVKKMRFPNLDLDLDFYKPNNKCVKVTRINGQYFRKNIIEKYNKCALTNINSGLCEAAHILPYNECNDFQKYNDNNGILLSCNMHKAFDKNYFTIDANTCKVQILYRNISNDNIDNIKEIELHEINNKYIKQLDNNISKYFLKMRNIKLNLI